MKKDFYILTLLLAAILTLGSCSSDDDEKGFSRDQNLYVGDSIKLSGKATIANDFVAYVTQSGYLYGYHVGATTITSNGQNANVVVRGRYNGLRSCFEIIGKND